MKARTIQVYYFYLPRLQTKRLITPCSKCDYLSRVSDCDLEEAGAKSEDQHLSVKKRVGA